MAAVKRQIIKREIVEWEILESTDVDERRRKLGYRATSATAETREALAGQSVEIGIIYRPSARHLHLDHQLPKPTISLKKGPVLWQVWVAATEKARTVKLWFPSGVFTENEKEIKINKDGYGDALLTPNPEFKLPDGSPVTVPITVPLAVFCDIDGGQDDDRMASKYKQKGLQMVDGPHSHPECDVGP